MESGSHHVGNDVTPRRDGFYRFEVISEERRRREWTADQKLAIVAESFATTSSISDVARRHQLNRNQLFQWRAQFRRGELGELAMGSFVPVTIAESSHTAAASPPTTGCPPDDPVIEVVIGMAIVRIPAAADDVTLRRVLAAVRDLR